jgi:hypothetical protein
MASILTDLRTIIFRPGHRYEHQKAVTRQNERPSSVVKILHGADASASTVFRLQHHLNIASCQDWSMLHTWFCCINKGSSGCLDLRQESQPSKHWIVTCSHSVSSAFGASYVLFSCEHELTFVENLITYQQRSPTSSHDLFTMRWHNSHSNCSQGGREGPYHLLKSLGMRVNAMAKLNRLAAKDHEGPHVFIEDFCGGRTRAFARQWNTS